MNKKFAPLEVLIKLSGMAMKSVDLPISTRF